MPAVSRQRPTFRPRLEALEDRCVPSILTVTNNLDNFFNPSPGSLRYEIGKAHNGDTIVFAPSLDGQTITLGGSELDITKSLTVQGPGAGLLTIDGGNPYPAGNTGSRVFAVEKKTNVTLSGLTITGGDGLAARGDIYHFGPNDDEGGGILNLGTLTVSSCTISGNFIIDLSAISNGGGIYNAGTLMVSSCTISGNYGNDLSASSYGGGIYNAGTLTVSNSTVSGNQLSVIRDLLPFLGSTVLINDGGGIYNAGTLTVSNSTISGNLAETDGGGIYNAGTATVSGCTLSSNGAGAGYPGVGGAIYNAGTLTVTACNLSGNTTGNFQYRGGGIYNAGTLRVSNSVFSGNFPDNIFGPYTDGGGNTFS
jgi:hypothetical protein